ncbi:MAG: cell division protein ZapA [Rikenellaceae bacterium]
MKKTFSVTIAGRRYWLEIDQSDEEVMRRGAKALNEKIRELQQLRFDCTSFDYLAMAAISKSIECEELKLRQKYASGSEELDELAAKVSRALED